MLADSGGLKQLGISVSTLKMTVKNFHVIVNVQIGVDNAGLFFE
jgi:hypothetical protein